MWCWWKPSSLLAVGPAHITSLEDAAAREQCTSQFCVASKANACPDLAPGMKVLAETTMRYMYLQACLALSAAVLVSVRKKQRILAAATIVRWLDTQLQSFRYIHVQK